MFVDGSSYILSLLQTLEAFGAWRRYLVVHIGRLLDADLCWSYLKWVEVHK